MVWTNNLKVIFKFKAFKIKPSLTFYCSCWYWTAMTKWCENDVIKECENSKRYEKSNENNTKCALLKYDIIANHTICIIKTIDI